jgi:hypothetical protein
LRASISLLLNFIGAIGLGYELLTAYPTRNRRANLERQLTALRGTVEYVEKSIKDYPVPPYTEDDKKRFDAELHAKFDPDMKKLDEEIKQLGEGHEARSFLAGWWGLLLLAGGFLLDAVSSLIAR